MKVLVIVIWITISFSATAAFSLYHPKAAAKKEIVLAVAKAQNKLALIQANYIVYHLNYSKENKNAAIFKVYGFPNRFGFPVFLVLNADGNLIHTQNSSYLELGKSYDAPKGKEFLLSCTNKALQASNYPYLYL
jgi:hypothetical protein